MNEITSQISCQNPEQVAKFVTRYLTSKLGHCNLKLKPAIPIIGRSVFPHPMPYKIDRSNDDESEPQCHYDYEKARQLARECLGTSAIVV